MLLFLQTTVHATNYKVYGTDLTVNLDDTEWYVFTRDNIENNDELASVGLSYEYMYDVLYNNMAYMNACLFYEDGSFLEFFIRKTDISDIVNLSNYDSDELQLLAEKLANRAGSEKYNIYESEYKYVNLEYVDSVSDVSLNICEYLTVVNGDSYTFTFQGNNDFSSSDYSEMKNIIDSIKFRVDESLDEPILSSVDDSKSSIFDGVLEKAIGGAILGGIVSLFGLIKSKKRKNIDINDEEEKVDGDIQPEIIEADTVSNEPTKGKKEFVDKKDISFNYNAEKVKQQIKEQIASTISKYNIIYKTDLLKIVFGDISKQFEDSENADKLICLYYQTAFDIVLSEDNDTNDFNFAYATLKNNVDTKIEIHKYLKLLVKIQSIIDEVKKHIDSGKNGKGMYAKVLKKHIFKELNAYVDDSSDWNKIK